MLNIIKGNIQEDIWNQAHKKVERYSHKYFHKSRGIKNNQILTIFDSHNIWKSNIKEIGNLLYFQSVNLIRE